MAVSPKQETPSYLLGVVEHEYQPEHLQCKVTELTIQHEGLKQPGCRGDSWTVNESKEF